VIVGPNLQFLKDLISICFEMEDLGECRWVLGMRVVRNRKKQTITLSQDRYAREVLDEFKMLNCLPTSVPLPPNALTCPVKDTPATNNYRQGMDLLQYMVQCTRPDLAFACSYLSQFLNRPSVTHQELFF
jgi:hypothetical protein